MPKSQPPNGISIVSVVFAQHVRVSNTQTNRYTDRPRYVLHLKQQYHVYSFKYDFWHDFARKGVLNVLGEVPPK